VTDYQIVGDDDSFLAGYLLSVVKSIEQGNTIGKTPPEFARFHLNGLVEDGHLETGR